MTTDPFVGLHTHSEYSFLDGRQTVPMMVARAVALDQTALAINDHGDCGGHVEFEKECKKQGIKPIFGMEGYLAHDTEERERKKDRYGYGHITLLAKTQLGLKNIWKLSTTGYKKYYQKPVCDWGDFRKYNQDVVATDGCLLSWMAKAIIADENEEVERLVQLYLDTYGDNFYMELHTWQIPPDPWGNPLSEKAIGLNADMSKVNQRKVEIAAAHGIPLIVVNDAHYDVPEEARNHQLIWQMSTNADQTEGQELALGHMMGSIEIVEAMRNHGIDDEVTVDAILNTRKIADSVEDVTTGIFANKVHIPLLTGSVEGDVELFKAQSADGYRRKYIETGRDTPETRERDKYEEDIIVGKGFAGYTAIVADYCKFAKGGPVPVTVLGHNGVPSPFTDKEPWLVGPTRGSGGGSIKNYCSDITEADPKAYGIPFERYIDPGRKSFPDIDLDFPQSKRPDMKRYLRWKYGEGMVASICTFSKIKYKSAVKDLGRAMGIPYPDCEKMSKLIEAVEKATIDDEVDPETGEVVELTWEDILAEKAQELLPWVQRYPELFKHMRDLVGIKRQHGVHPSGVLISPVDLFEELPLRWNKNLGEFVTQFDMYVIEELGFIKFDILGIRHLDTIMTTDKFVHGTHDPRRFYDMSVEDLSDPVTGALIASGETLGIFTLETPGMIGVAKRMLPASERDVSHLTSLNRPGVIKSGGVERFLRRRAGRERAKTPHPMVDEILKDTYGVFVYQDQVLEAVRTCAGYSFTESDRFRKILGKKKMDQMRAEKSAFIERCLANEEFVAQSTYHLPDEAAHMIWDEIEPAGTYAFNLAHALGYGLLSWWSAYQKANHYFENVASLMITDSDRVPEYLREARNRGFKILPPNINKSMKKFAPVDGALLFGLDSIDKVGDVAVETILAHRAQGEFVSLEDFFQRVPGKVNKGHVVNLISIGAFDDMIADQIEVLGLDARNTLIRDYFALRAAKDKTFARADAKAGIPKHDYSTMLSVAALEFSLVKTYITNDPDDRYADMISEVCIRNMSEVQMVERGMDLYIGGKIDRVKVHKSTKPGRNLGRSMAFLDISWRGSEFNVVCFFDAFELWGGFFEVEAPVIAKVEKTDKNSLSLVDVIRLDWLLDGKEQ